MKKNQKRWSRIIKKNFHYQIRNNPQKLKPIEIPLNHLEEAAKAAIFSINETLIAHSLDERFHFSNIEKKITPKRLKFSLILFYIDKYMRKNGQPIIKQIRLLLPVN
jgi:hypothetical protein